MSQEVYGLSGLFSDVCPRLGSHDQNQWLPRAGGREGGGSLWAEFHLQMCSADLYRVFKLVNVKVPKGT